MGDERGVETIRIVDGEMMTGGELDLKRAESRLEDSLDFRPRRAPRKSFKVFMLD